MKKTIIVFLIFCLVTPVFVVENVNNAQKRNQEAIRIGYTVSPSKYSKENEIVKNLPTPDSKVFILVAGAMIFFVIYLASCGPRGSH